MKSHRMPAGMSRYWSDARWAIGRVWRSNPGLSAGMIVTMTIRAAVPAGIALASRGLINAVVKSIHNGHPSFDPVIPWLIAGFVLALLLALSDVFGKLFSQLLYDHLNQDITCEILDHASTLDISYFESPEYEDVMERAQQNAAAHFTQFIVSSVSLAAGVIQLTLLIAILFKVEPAVILAFVAIGSPYLLFRWRLVLVHYTKEYSRTTKQRWTRYFVNRLTSQASVTEVKLFDLAPVLFEKYRALSTSFLNEDAHLYKKEFKGAAIFVTVSTMAFYLAFIHVAWRSVHGALSVGDVLLYGVITASVRKTLDSMIQSASAGAEQTLYISNLREFLNLKSKLHEPEANANIIRRGRIAFRNVTFAYPGNTEPAVKSVSLEIEEGETVAIVGENGAGKSSFAKLLARLYDPDEGCVQIDDVDVREFAMPELRKKLSFMLQRFGHYEGTAAENIAYGNWHELLQDPTAIEQTARRARIHATIERMPQGYQTLLGRLFGTYDASEGQWQQIALARAFSRNASIFILDEPASHLDAKIEHEIFSRFRDLARGRTTILISHRFSTVGMADRIFVMERGRIVESGTHSELLNMAGSYARLYELHSRQMFADT